MSYEYLPVDFGAGKVQVLEEPVLRSTLDQGQAGRREVYLDGISTR